MTTSAQLRDERPRKPASRTNRAPRLLALWIIVPVVGVFFGIRIGALAILGFGLVLAYYRLRYLAMLAIAAAVILFLLLYALTGRL